MTRAYVRGIVWALTEEGFTPSGWEGVLGGNIPTGAGLSSSAALELALLRAFRSVSGWDWDGVTMARVARKAENSYVGVQSGIMDQMASALGEKGKALLIDTRNLTWRSVPLVPGVRVVILDTGTRRGLVDSVYNQRVSECQAAAEILEVNSLREADREKLEAGKGEMESAIYRRAFHVVTENERTLQAAEAMEKGDPVLLGRLVDASHESLRVNYQVSSPELDLMVKIARGQPGTYGARMTGAGFGGAAIAFVSEENLASFITEVGGVYARETGKSPTLIPTRASQGAEQLY
ncbi:MAG: hypothetical protein U5K99_00880 [Anaerolineales bacterium]|nr:hypothetical protein [Anaerolineales bacterium]